MKRKRNILFALLTVFLAPLVFAACGMAEPPGEEQAALKDFIASGERKIIYTASFTIVCDDFKAGVELIENSLQDGEWFDEARYSGNNYAYFTARVSTARLNDYIKEISGSKSVKEFNNFTKTATDISLDYYDNQGQIEALEAERARLIELMDIDGATVSDIILISTRLSAVDYELQKLRGELYKFDSKVDYSIVNITVNEVSYAWIAGIIIPFVLLATGITVPVILWKVNKKKKKQQPFNCPPPPQSPPPQYYQPPPQIK